MRAAQIYDFTFEFATLFRMESKFRTLVRHQEKFNCLCKLWSSKFEIWPFTRGIRPLWIQFPEQRADRRPQKASESVSLTQKKVCMGCKSHRLRKKHKSAQVPKCHFTLYCDQLFGFIDFFKGVLQRSTKHDSQRVPSVIIT